MLTFQISAYENYLSLDPSRAMAISSLTPHAKKEVYEVVCDHF